jgi:predicted transcriptional regulator
MMPNEKASNGRAVKERAREIVDWLAPDATWDDLMYQIYVRQAIEAGIADADAGRVIDVREVRARFGLLA